VGPSRYVELVNQMYAIYDRSGSQLNTGTLGTLTNDPGAVNLTDPQVIWDPGTNRFYYTVLNDATNMLDIGFSRTTSPSSGAGTDWCQYTVDFGYGTNLPDYPKLGDTTDFLLIGVNVFDPTGNFVQSDVDWMTKPGSGSSCPLQGSFKASVKKNLLRHDGSQAFTPVPANQTDPGPTGYVVAGDYQPTGGTSTFIDVYTVTRNTQTGAAVVGAAAGHALPTSLKFTIPPPAAQPSPYIALDSLDGRLTQAISAFDPSEGGIGIWTQNTVDSSAIASLSQLNWYEVNPTSGLWRGGSVQDNARFVFNGAISPDRLVNGAVKAFGDAYVIGFSTSSTGEAPRVYMVSGYRDLAPSTFVLVKDSTGPNDDFSCYAPNGPPCRWGDYSGATPDPGATRFANHGEVWLSNQWSAGPGSKVDVDWRTENWASNPVPFVTMNTPDVTFQVARLFGVSWSFGDSATAADVRYRVAPFNGWFGKPKLWLSKTMATNQNIYGTPGTTMCFSGQSYDSSGTAYGFSGDRCTAIPLDDRSLTPAGSWSRLSGSGYYRMTFSQSSSTGATLSQGGIRARRVSVLVEKCPTCGSIQIFWNGHLTRSYSLFAPSVEKLVYLYAANFKTVQKGSITIRVSSSGKPVIIDGLGVSRI
jgi:hypothetical protein